MELDIDTFIDGVNNTILKTASTSIFALSGPLFPSINSQAKWRVHKEEKKLHLNDGQTTYSFEMPNGISYDKDFSLVKLEEAANLKKEDTRTIQVHRSSPDEIYFTMHDGVHNPTFTFKQVEGNEWRAQPKIKNKIKNIDKKAFLEGVEYKLAEEVNGIMPNIIDTLLKSTDAAGRAAISTIMATGHNPVASAGIGLLGGAAYDLGKRKFYNSEEENAAETPMDRLQRYVLPTVGLGATGGTLRSLFRNYYEQYPEWKP